MVQFELFNDLVNLLYLYFVGGSVSKTSAFFSWTAWREKHLNHWSRSPFLLSSECPVTSFPFFFPISFPRFCHKFVLQSVWRVLIKTLNRWAFCVIYSLGIRCVKAFIVTTLHPAKGTGMIKLSALLRIFQNTSIQRNTTWHPVTTEKHIHLEHSLE